MASLTSNASCSPSTISVSGKKTSTGTISWSTPSIPNGATINSCTLTGKASSFTTGNKGATLTINGTSVSSGSSFTINFGTNTSTTSVTASFAGGHNQTNTSVTLSNLVYTVDYTAAAVTYTVTFVDWDGTVLKTQTVTSGNSATAPSNPSRTGYEFTGWDKTFSNVTGNLTVTAQYIILKCTVTFVDWDESVIKTQSVSYGGAAIAPGSPSREGYDFIGWDKDFTNVINDLIVTAQYSEKSIGGVKSSFMLGLQNVEKMLIGPLEIKSIYIGETIVYISE